MSPLRIYGSTSGYTEIAPNSVAPNNTLTLPSTGSSLVSQDASGNISISGILTATNFVGNLTGTATGLTGTPNIVLGIATVSAGTTSAPSITPTGDSNTGVFFPSADTIAFAEGGVEAARFDSSGRLLVGTSSARSIACTPQISVESVQTGTEDRGISIINGGAATSSPILNFGKHRSGTIGGSTIVASGDFLGAVIFNGSDGTNFIQSALISAQVDGTPGTNDMPGRLVFSTTADGASSATERVRIDSQGRMGVGTNSPNSLIHVLDSVGSSRISIESSGSGGVLATFTAERGGGLRIASESAAGWLAFNTGQSGTTERMRLDSGGALRHTGSGSISVTTGYSTVGCAMEPNGTLLVTRSSAGPGFFNRLTDDGTLVVFAQDTVTEGTISVSGTTVSYNGAHLSRWSQLVNVDPYDKTQRPEILRGTIMSNLDEMCEWIDLETGEAQDNEQLNKTKISDIEGDKNVAGVFQSWDDDDDTWVNDYYLAMTGDFVIRIAEGVTVERGDLLMSAGDGTAKPQIDDAVRSCTVAKVTSTNVTCTYDDGSYCVPCVLMAC